MQKTKAQTIRPVTAKQKLASAFMMLLFAAVLMTSASYAWFELINATQTQHISANVGANGSLEIALLNTDTRSDMTTIRADIGDSLAENNLLANNSWGNLVDLEHVDYGLGNICLMPARLNVAANVADGSYTVDSGLLAVPTYGYDGRIVELTYNTVSAVYQEEAFAVRDGVQDFGVRGIGTSDILSAQASALAMAKSDISANTQKIKSSVITALGNSGTSLFNIVMFHLMDPNTTYIDEDREAIKAVLEELDGVLRDMESVLRQGLVAYAAAQIGDEAAFLTAKEIATDASVELSQTLGRLEGRIVLPETYHTWVSELDATQTKLNAARIACENLTGNNYTWKQIRSIMDYVMDIDRVMLNEYWLGDLNPDQIDSLIGDMLEKGFTMVLKKDSGIYADIAEFVDDYSTIIKVEIIDVMVVADNEEDPAYLVGLAEAVRGLKAAQSTTASPLVPLTATFGYALDLAFRCNTDGADLLLQTTPRHRVYNEEGQESTAASTLGSGSYMAFHTFDKPLADAIRVTFLDDQGTLLGMAKLNTENRAEVDHMIQIPLQMYDYSFETDEAGFYLVMADQPKTDPTIVSKEQMTRNVPKAVTVVVWLDGDIVDNTMVSATEQTSLSGVMNLQFATSAKLVPVQDGALIDYTADKAGLETLLRDCEETAAAGQGDYTTVSWKAFSAAYNRAVRVYWNQTADEQQIREAIVDLVNAEAGLDAASREAVNTKVLQLRRKMGTLEQETARLVIQNPDGSYAAVGSEEHTQQEHDSWQIVGQISRVDYSRNLRDEGNGILTPIYTEESWNTLAGALYVAEAVLQNQDATAAQLNAALSAMETAEANLQRQVFFKPYLCQGSIWYEAICEAENADTYGKWYDSGFRRILSDLTIANLDAYAEPVQLTQIRQDLYVSSDTEYINPDIEFLEAIYPQLREESVKGVKWNSLDPEFFVESMNTRHLAAISELLGVVQNESLDVDTSAASALVEAYAGQQKPTAAQAEGEIRRLNDAVVAELEKKAEEETAESAEMTASQRILLTTALEKAKSVEDWASRSDLAQAVADAQRLLTTESTVSRIQAANALSALNTALKAADADEVTEYNTLTHKLPEGTGSADILYEVEYPDIVLQLTGKSGVSTIGAKILTQSGIVISVSKEITVYDRADGLAVAVADTGAAVPSLTLEAGDSVDLTAQLLYAAGGQNTGDKPLEGLVRETIKTFLWASEDTSVASAVGKEGAVCTITALAAGQTRIGVLVETVEGNAYTLSIPLTVQEIQ